MYLPEQQLAFRVIMQAIMDACSKPRMNGTETKDQRDARMFLKGSTKAWKESLAFWCSIAKIHIDRVIKAAKRMEEQGWPKIPKGLIAMIEKGTADETVASSILKGGDL